MNRTTDILREHCMHSYVLVRHVLLNVGACSVAYWPFSATDVLAQSAQRTPTQLERSVYTRIKPGDDFFAYANGAWLAAAAIPVGQDRWGVRDEINDQTRRQLAALFEDARSAPPGSVARMVADYRAALLDGAAIEAGALAPLKAAFDRIDTIADKPALVRLIGSTMRADVDPLNVGIYTSATLLGLSVEHSIHGEHVYTPFLLQGGLALGDRDEYLLMDAHAIERRGRYRSYIARLLTLAGYDNAEKRAESLLALETLIAETQATNAATAVDRNADNQWTHDDYIREAPGINWHEFFNAAGLAEQNVIVAWQPTAVRGVAKLIATQPLDSWKDYLRFHAIHDHVDALPHAFGDAAAGMRNDARSRDERALAATETAMADAIGELYSTRYFSATQKTRVRRIIANVSAAFREHASRVTWLSPASRKTALAKIDELYVGIGYPESNQDWSDLRVTSGDAYGNMDRVTARNYGHAVRRLSAPYDPHEWSMTPQTVGGVLVFQQNAYEITAALLQPPKYDSTASDAATYGAIGAVIGHDITHFVDPLGADYEPGGRMHHWWSADDSVNFVTAAKPLVAQYSGYQPLIGAHVDGLLTRSENVADLAGLTAAFEAYRHSLGSTSTDKAHVRSSDREFFIAFAQTFRTRMNDAAMRAQLSNDHAPAMYRVNTVRNLDAWYLAFDVRPGQRLFLEPKARVRVW